MEIKTAAWGTVALVITAFGAVVIYAIEREGIKNDLTKARNEMASMQSMLDTRRKSLADRQEAYAALQDRVAAITSASDRIKLQQSRNDKTSASIEQLRADWGKTRAAFAKDIDLVRQKTKDETVATMTLADGSELKTVRFKEMKDATVILEHGAGIAKVPLANMPNDWIGRLALGWNPKLSAELSGKPDEVVAEAPVAAPSKTAEMVIQEHKESVKRADVTDAAGRIKVLERKIAEAEKAKVAQLEIARQYAYKHNLALSKGNTSSHGVKRDEANRSALNLASQIEAAHASIEKLQQEISAKSR